MARKARAITADNNLPLDSKGGIDMRAVLIAALTVPGKLSNAYNRFHRYSFLNMVLVFMQTGKMEPMGTFKRWNALGRKVISGPGSALFVNHPKFAPDVDKVTGQPRKDGDGKTIMRFVGAYPKPTVFQLSQTDGPELTLPTTPEWSKDEALAALEVTEEPFSHGDGNTQGYSHVVEGQKRFALNPLAVAPFKTMIHELAHLTLGHCEGGEQDHRGVQEFQAEAVALLVCRELDIEGFDDSASRGYIQHWLGGRADEYVSWSDTAEDNTELDDSKVIRAIFTATDRILVAGRTKHYAKLADQ